MAYKLITEVNLSRGIHMIPIYINEMSGGLFMKLVILSVWIICTFGSFFMQKKVNNGIGDFPSSLAVGGFVTMVISTILIMIPGLVDSITYAFVIIIGGVSILYFLFTQNNN